MGRSRPTRLALVGGLLETKRRALETVEIEERLARLEARK